MKPTQITELFANIRKTFVSFFSILMFVALGVGIFLGIDWSGPALQAAADAQFQAGALHHAQISYPYGFTESDLAELEAIEGVEAVEPARQAFASFADGTGARVAKFQTAGTAIDVMDVVEGSLPAQAGEVALEAIMAEELGLGVGDVLAIAQDAPGTGDTPQLAADTFTVTALVHSPEYLSLMKGSYGFSPYSSGAVDMLAWVAAASFDDDAYQGAYPVVNVRYAGMEGLGTFTDAHEQAAVPVIQRIEDVGNELANKRYGELHDQAQGLVDDGQEKIDDGKAQLDEGKRQLADAEQQVADAQEQIDGGQAELDAKRAEFEASRAEGETKLQSARAELDDAQGQYDSAAAQYDAARAEYDEKRMRYDRVVSAAEDAKATLDNLADAKAKLDAGLASGDITQDKYDTQLGKLVDQANEAIAAYAQALQEAGENAEGQCVTGVVDVPVVTAENFDESLDAARMLADEYRTIPIEVEGKTTTIDEIGQSLDEAGDELDAAAAELASKKRELDDGWGQYYAGEAAYQAQVAEAQDAIAAAEAQLADARAQVEEGKRQIQEKKPQLEEAQSQLAEKEAELDDAKEQLAAMRAYDVTVAERASNGGVAQVSTLSDVTRSLALSIAALFVIIGLLVSYSAVSRIVHEQVTQIGTKKALGLRGREITTSFLAYSAFAVLLGAALGAAVGFAVVERIISHTVGSMFTLGDYAPHFGWGLFAAITALELALVLGATWLACRSVLRRQAVALLRGEEPPKAKTRFYERWGLWNHLPLFTQTIVNNCMNDKRRVFSTIVGVTGATALIVCAITLNDDVLASYDTHYRDVFGFNAIGFVEDADAGDADAVERALQGQGATTAQVVRCSYAATLDDGTRAVVRIVVPADMAAFSQLYHIDAVESPAFDPDADAVWASRAMAEHLGMQVGDAITLEGTDGVRRQLTIGGFYNFGLAYHELVMGRSAYERAFGTAFAPNAVLADTGGKTAAQVAEALAGTPGLASVVDDKADQRANFDIFSGISRTVVLVYLALATLMAIVVLLNLNVMFIEEKKRELIVLMINGFSVRDAKRYIYRDTIVLTVVGIVVGLVLGSAMGSLTVASIEPTTASFVKGVAWRAIAAGIAGSAVLAAAMTLVALRRIPRFALTDINKF